MTMTNPTPNAPKSSSDDEFGAGIMDQPPAKPAARATPERARATEAPAAPAKKAPPIDEDDGFGSGLL